MSEWIVIETDKYVFTDAQSDNNALCVYSLLTLPEYGSWTVEAAAAVCGNFRGESFINPGQWEGGQMGNTKRGYGLAQWTPAAKLINWCSANGIQWQGNGNGQISYLWNNPQEWNTDRSPVIDMNLVKFSQAKLDLDTMSDYWLHYYEQPTAEQEEASRQLRRDYTKRYYALFTGHEPPDPPKPPEPPGPSPSGSKLKIYYWCRPVPF